MTSASPSQFKTSLWRVVFALAGEGVGTTGSLGRAIGMKTDQVYTTLVRLERTGIVRRDGVYWSLTEAGKQVVRDFAHDATIAAERIGRR
jgi:DNA-binding HxlR family transcriptional regulator